MTIENMSEQEMEELFVKTSIERILAGSFVEALGKQIQHMPKHEQRSARQKVRALKKDPLAIFRDELPESEMESLDEHHIDMESESYKYFMKMGEKLFEYAKNNKDKVKEVCEELSK